MIIDSRTEFADSSSIGTPNNTTVNVGNVLDLVQIGRGAGQGKPLYLIIGVTAAFTSGGASVARLMLSSDSTSTIAVDGSQTTHWQSDELAVAGFPLGAKFVVPFPTQYPTDERFVGVQVRESGGVALTGGAIDAFLSFDPIGTKHFPDAAN